MYTIAKRETLMETFPTDFYVNDDPRIFDNYLGNIQKTSALEAKKAGVKVGEIYAVCWGYQTEKGFGIEGFRLLQLEEKTETVTSSTHKGIL